MTLSQVVGIIFVFVGHTLWLSNLSYNRFGKIRTGFIYSLLFVIATLICTFLGTTVVKDFNKAVMIMFITALLLFFLFYIILSKNNFFKNLFLFITYANFFCIIHNISYLLTGYMCPDKNMFYTPVAISIRLCLQLGGLFIYLKYLDKEIKRIEVSDKKQWLPLCIASILFFCPHAVWTAVGTNVWSYTATDIIVFILLFVVTVGLYVVIFYTMSYMTEVSEFNLIKQQSKYLLEQIKNYEISENANIRLRHDIRHHMMNVAAFAKEGNTSSILDYIKEYDREIMDLTKKQYSKHNVVNNIISIYSIKFQECETEFKSYSNIPENLTIKDLDLVSLLGNLLENALNCCKQLEKEYRKTNIYLSVHNNKFIIVCENICKDKLELVDNLPKNKSIGVASISYICAKYKGTVNYSIKNEICSVCAVLNL